MNPRLYVDNPHGTAGPRSAVTGEAVNDERLKLSVQEIEVRLIRSVEYALGTGANNA
jgi:hypothetical protein